MARLNLQMFAYTGTSIVDYLNKNGKDSSFSARKKLAEANGIKNYSGTAQQNTTLLNTLRGSNTSNTTNKTNTSKTTTSKTTTSKTTTSSKPTSKLKGVDGKTYKTMTSEFKPSTAYQEAMANVTSILERINSGKTSYTDQLKGLISDITNREKFTYDVESDTMFQQYLSSMMQSGQTAMQDTMGQASALTGGYGSSYSQSVGNQAYNQYVQGAYDNLPEYYQMALNKYQMEGEELYNQYAMVSDADAQEYARLVDSYNINSGHANTLYGQDYQTWSDKVTNATNLAGMQNSDWWNTKEFNENVRQFDLNFNENKRQFNETMSFNKNKANSSGGSNAKAYKLTDSEIKKIGELYNSKGGGETGEKAVYDYLKAKGKAPSDSDAWNIVRGAYGGNDGTNTSVKEPTETQKSKALKAFSEGGQSALDQYVDSLPSDVDMDAIDSYVNKYGQLPLEQRTFTKVKDTFNWFWGDDNNDKVKDQYGNEYRIDELPKSIRSALTKLAEGKSWTNK